MRVHAGSTRAYNSWTYTRNCNIFKTLLYDFSGTYWKLILKLYSLQYICVCLKDTTYELDEPTQFACHFSLRTLTCSNISTAAGGVAMISIVIAAQPRNGSKLDLLV
jgi:hypothetical protein